MLINLFFALIACSPESENHSDMPTTAFDDLADTGNGQAHVLHFLPHAADGLSVEQVEPSRYLGLWYEVATTPSPQRDFCSGTMAEYSLISEEKIGVTNRCYVGDLNGELNEVQATARPLDDTFARLMVDFGYGFESPYTVVELVQTAGQAEYTYATVSNNDVQLWILSRTAQMPTDVYDELLARLDIRYESASRLTKTEQPRPSE